MFKKKLGWNRSVVILFMLPPIILQLCCSIIPSLITLLYSFTNITSMRSGYDFLGLQNYKQIFFLQNYRDIFDDTKRTILFAFVVTAAQNIIGVLLAVMFNSIALKGRNLYRAIVFLPYVLGGSIICYTWVLLMGVDGPILALCKNIGIDTKLLGGQKDAFKCVMFISVWGGVGYTMVLDLAGLQGIPLELYESATIDGANGAQSFLKITVPLLWETLSINILLCIIGSLGVMQTVLLTTGGYQATETLGLKIYKDAFNIAGNSTARTSITQGYAAAETMVMFALTMFFVFCTNWITKRVGNKYE